MEERKNVDNITKEEIEEYEAFLLGEGRSGATVEKYVRDVKKFREILLLLGYREIDEKRVLEYKEYLKDHYKLSSVNSMLAAMNSFLEFMGWDDCKVKLYQVPRALSDKPETELTETDYNCLVRTAEKKGDVRLSLLVQTICSTGIRVSELKFITVEALGNGQAVIGGREKSRVAPFPAELRNRLSLYCEKMGIKSGRIFITKGGLPLDRSNINKMMKELGREAGVDERKVFPHNFRHVFARIFYGIGKDVVWLMDLRGYSNKSTDKIYKVSGETRPMAQLKLVIKP